MKLIYEKFREIAGNSAPELPDLTEKVTKIRQFGVFTNFLSIYIGGHTKTLCLLTEKRRTTADACLQGHSVFF